MDKVKRTFYNLIFLSVFLSCNSKTTIKEQAPDDQELIENNIKNTTAKYSINADVIYGNDIVHNWNYEFNEGDVLNISGIARPFEKSVNFDDYPRLSIEPFNSELSISGTTINLLFPKKYLQEVEKIMIGQKIMIKGRLGKRFFSVKEWNVDGCSLMK